MRENEPSFDNQPDSGVRMDQDFRNESVRLEAKIILSAILIFIAVLGLSIWFTSPTNSEEYGRATAFPLILAAVYYFSHKSP